MKSMNRFAILFGLLLSGVRSFQPTTQSHAIPSLLQKERIGHTRLQSALLTTASAGVDAFFRNAPYTAAAIVCGFKASAADVVAQRRQYKKRIENGDELELNEDGSLKMQGKIEIDMRRNLAYMIYGSIYQGVVQEHVYNHIYPVIFGTGIDLATVVTKVAFDMFFQTTLVTLPVAYLSKALIYKYSFGEAMRRYVDDIKNHKLLVKYYALWIPVMGIAFRFVPDHFRVSFIAMVSFFWLIILSSIASKARVIQDEECSLVDGSTCNIDG